MVDLPTPASPYYSPRGGISGGHRLPSTTTNNNSKALSNISILMTAFLAILATGGPTYSFGVYARTLKEEWHLTQGQLETLGAASFGAGFVSWMPGLAVDAWGPRLALLVGGTLQSLGLAIYWVVVLFGAAWVPPMAVIPILCSLSVLIFTANNLVIGGVFKSIVVSCGLGTKGKAVGAGKAYLGLGAGVFTTLFKSFHRESDLDFLVMCAILALAAIVVPALLGLPTKEATEKYEMRDKSTNLHYTVLYTGLFLLALVVVGTNVLILFQHNPESDETMEDPAAAGRPSVLDLILNLPEWLHGTLIIALWVGPVLGLGLVPTATAQRDGHRKRYLHSQSTMERQKERQAAEDTPEKNQEPKTRQVRLSRVRSSSNKKNGESTPLLLLPPNGDSKVVAYDSSVISTAAPVDADAEQGETRKDRNNTTTSAYSEREQDEWIEIVVCETPRPVPDMTLPQMLKTTRAWLFLASATILVGSGTMLTINMGQMVQARGYARRVTAASLALFSVAQALARVAAGAVSEAALRWPTRVFGVDGVPRTAFLVVPCAFAVAGHGVLAIPSSDDEIWGEGRYRFITGIVLTGISFGSLWPLMVLVIGDVFGTVNHGANYMFADGFTCAVGTLSIAKFLTQAVYEQHVVIGGTTKDGLDTACYGEECFQLTHLIIAGLCSLSLVACVLLLYMTRSSYGTVSSR